MATFVDRPNTALLIVDVQQGNTDGAHDREAVIARINALLDQARRTATAVVWVQHADEHLVEGSPEWQYADELTRDESEPLVHKHFGDAFEETELDDLLARSKVGRIVVTGASTDMCIRATLHGAMARGYDATLVGDAHTLEDPSTWGLPFNAEQVIAFTNSYWDEAAAPGRGRRHGADRRRGLHGVELSAPAMDRRRGQLPGGPARIVGTYSSSWMLPSKVRLLIISNATSG